MIIGSVDVIKYLCVLYPLFLYLYIIQHIIMYLYMMYLHMIQHGGTLKILC